MFQTLKQTGLGWLWLSVLVLVLDQWTKKIIISQFRLYETLPVLDVFSLTYVRNTGAAFSFLSDAGGWQLWFFSTAALFVVGLLSYWLYQQKYSVWCLNSAYTLIIGGALGNVVDRIQYGYVVDFLDFHWGVYHFPAFNVADMAICLGAGLIILDAIMVVKKAEKS